MVSRARAMRCRRPGRARRRHRRDRPAGARRGGPRARARRDGRPRRDRRPRAGSSTCRARRRRACASSRSRCCSTTRMPRSTSRCRTRSRSSPISSARQKVKVSDTARPAFDTARHARGLHEAAARGDGRAGMPDEEYERDARPPPRAFRPTTRARSPRCCAARVLSHRDWLALNERRHRMRLAWDGVLPGLRRAALPGRLDARPSRTTTSPTG